MMTPEELKTAKKKKGYTSRKLAELSGVPLGTIQKIMSGATSSPRLDTMNALERVLMEPGTVYSYASSSGISSQPQLLQDTASPFTVSSAEKPDHAHSFSSQKSTVSSSSKPDPVMAADEDPLKQTVLHELIAGKRFTLPVCGGIHQILACEVYRQLSDAALKAEKNPVSQKASLPAPVICLSPFPLELPGQPGSLLFPDVFVLDSQAEIYSGRITGIPSLVIEVTSPSTRKKDTSLKLETYVSAGVSEYWILDSTDRSIIRWDIAHNNQMALFTFGVPVRVLTESVPCTVDTTRFDELIRQYAALKTV